jgi:cyclic pyranopterin phosphate synthase
VTRQQPIHQKPVVFRSAQVEGDLSLSARTRAAIRARTVAKGDPLAVGEIAGLSAMKRTSDLIPHCHIVPLTGSEVRLRLTGRGVTVRATAETLGRTGVEMEALVGATGALLTVWDMVKYLEKNEDGQYPDTVLGPVRVIQKKKERTEAE